MDKELFSFNTLIGILGTGFTWAFGSWDLALQVLVCFIVLDYITGFLRGLITKGLSSDIGFHGIARKSIIFVVLICAVLLDRLLNGDTWVFRTLVAYFYIANEGISILENCAALGLPIPHQIQDVLLQLKEGNKKEKIRG